MITLLADNNRQKNAESRARNKPVGLGKNDAVLNELRFNLSNNLQSSLDLKDIISSFFEHVCTLNQSTGVHYQNPDADIHLQFGDIAKHSARYQISCKDERLGEVLFFRSHVFTEAELALIELIIGVLFYPLRNALKYRQALESSLIDSLTGVNNRFALDLNFTREMKLAKRHMKALSVLLIDIDHFKNINDSHGHLFGDEALKEVCNVIRCTLRETDQVFRYGGEEFVAVLNETDMENAIKSAERTRSAIAQHPIVCGKTRIHATVSIGVSSLAPDDTFEALFTRADRALYAAKNQGRDRVLYSKSDATEERVKIA